MPCSPNTFAPGATSLRGATRDPRRGHRGFTAADRCFGVEYGAYAVVRQGAHLETLRKRDNQKPKLTLAPSRCRRVRSRLLVFSPTALLRWAYEPDFCRRRRRADACHRRPSARE